MLRLAMCMAAATAVAASIERPTPGGQSGPGNVVAAIDLDESLRRKNRGGSDGAGLCVYTSVEHAAKWQGCDSYRDLQAWASRRPGGSYPRKLARDLAEVDPRAAANVVQHNGGDMDFLDDALRANRMPGVTYCGYDPLYGYASPIAHMVNLAHLDEASAAILDNNAPNRLMWMSRGDFEKRWNGNQGGWAVVLPNHGPPPVPRN